MVTLLHNIGALTPAPLARCILAFPKAEKCLINYEMSSRAFASPNGVHSGCISGAKRGNTHLASFSRQKGLIPVSNKPQKCRIVYKIPVLSTIYGPIWCIFGATWRKWNTQTPRHLELCKHLRSCSSTRSRSALLSTKCIVSLSLGWVSGASVFESRMHFSTL